jgi:hypothetical protein
MSKLPIISFAVLLTVCNFAIGNEKPQSAIHSINDEVFVEDDPCGNFVSNADCTEEDHTFIPPTTELNFDVQGE